MSTYMSTYFASTSTTSICCWGGGKQGLHIRSPDMKHFMIQYMIYNMTIQLFYLFCYNIIHALFSIMIISADVYSSSCCHREEIFENTYRAWVIGDADCDVCNVIVFYLWCLDSDMDYFISVRQWGDISYSFMNIESKKTFADIQQVSLSLTFPT